MLQSNRKLFDWIIYLKRYLFWNVIDDFLDELCETRKLQHVFPNNGKIFQEAKDLSYTLKHCCYMFPQHSQEVKNRQQFSKTTFLSTNRIFPGWSYTVVITRDLMYADQDLRPEYLQVEVPMTPWQIWKGESWALIQFNYQLRSDKHNYLIIKRTMFDLN